MQIRHNGHKATDTFTEQSTSAYDNTPGKTLTTVIVHGNMKQTSHEIHKGQQNGEMMLHNYRMTITYDGSRYSGWQKQGNTQNTIQERIETALTKLLQEEIEIHGSGRTDAGVHALGQVANFKTRQPATPDAIQQYLNQYLPMDIRIMSVSEVEPRFHARLNAARKHYRYQIDNHAVANIFERKYLTRFSDRDYFGKLADKQNRLLTCHVSDTTFLTSKNTHETSSQNNCQITYDQDAMNQAASILMGEHDFKSFCDNRHMKKSTVRILEEITIRENENHILSFDFYGNGFLYHMVRILTGTLLEVGIGAKSPEEMTNILHALNRQAAGFTVPPQGLFLVEVEYD